MAQAFGFDTVRLSWPLRVSVPTDDQGRFLRTRGGLRYLQRHSHYVRTRIVETARGWKVTVCGSLARMARGHNRDPLPPEEAEGAARRMLRRAIEAFPFLAFPDSREVKVQRLDLAMSTTIPYTRRVAEGIMKAAARIGHKRPYLYRGRQSSTYYSHRLSRGGGEPSGTQCVYGKPLGSGWRGPRFLRVEVRFYSGVLRYRLGTDGRTLDRLSTIFQVLVPLAMHSLQREFRWVRPIGMHDLRQIVGKMGNRGPRENRSFIKKSTIDFVWMAQEAGPWRLIEDGIYEFEETETFLELLSALKIGVGDPEIPELAMFADVLGV